MHYVMECHGTQPDQAEPVPPDDETHLWMSGTRFEDPSASPLVMEWDPDTEDGERLAFYEGDPLLMTKELVVALQETGVDNLDTYETVIRSPSGKEDCHDYLAVNIIGAIAVADMEQSETIDIHGTGTTMIDVDFESLVIDEEKAAGHLFFRLAECVSAVIVGEPVVEHLKKKGGFGLTFLDPKDFCG